MILSYRVIKDKQDLDEWVADMRGHDPNLHRAAFVPAFPFILTYQITDTDTGCDVDYEYHTIEDLEHWLLLLKEQ